MRKYTLLVVLFLIALSIQAQDNFILSANSHLAIEGTSTVHDWTVTANTLQGDVKAKGMVPYEIDFQVAVADIKSERGATMDKKMHAALQNQAHPKVKFSLKEFKNGSIFLGTLTIAGKQQEVEIAGDMDTSSDSIKISGAYGIALKDFEIEPPTAMFGQVIVGDDVTVKFNLIFEKE